MQTGINTTMIASIMMGLFGDRPGLCNGASGAIAVVVVDLVCTLTLILTHAAACPAQIRVHPAAHAPQP